MLFRKRTEQRTIFLLDTAKFHRDPVKSPFLTDAKYRPIKGTLYILLVENSLYTNILLNKKEKMRNPQLNLKCTLQTYELTDLKFGEKNR